MSRKEIAQIIACLRTHFGFLFDIGYEIVYTEDTHSFDNVLIILGSKDAKLRFSQDRSEIQMAVGPAWAENGWSDPNYTDLDVILGLLEHYDEFRNYEGDLRDQDAQVKRLAELVYPRLEKIISMMQMDRFPQTERELNIQWEKMMNNFKSQYKQISIKQKSKRQSNC